MTSDPELAAGFDLAALPPGFAEDPFPVYRALLEHAPLKRFADGSVMVSRWEDLDRIYRDTKRFSSAKFEEFRPKFGDSPLYRHHTTSLVFNDPLLHTRVRRILVGALTPRAIAAEEPALVRLVDSLIDDLAQRGEADLIESYAARIPIEVIGNLLDIPHEERAPLRDWSLAILGALEPVLTSERAARGNAAVTDFTAYLRDLVARRRARPGDPATDVLTRLIASDEPLSEAELLQNCVFILNAGHETTTNLIGNALLELTLWPDERARLIADPSLADTAVDEMLRFQSPNQLGNRRATDAVEIQGETLPPGTAIHLCIGAANRDPRQFPEPDRLDVGRKPNKHLAFAGGPHTCLGFTLARMEGRVALTRFLARFPGYEISGRPERTGRVRFRGLAKLPARLA